MAVESQELAVPLNGGNTDMTKKLLCLALLAIAPGYALAAPQWEEQVRDGKSTSPMGDVDADEPTGTWSLAGKTYGWPNLMMKGGEYRVMSNLWDDEALLGQAPAANYTVLVGWGGNKVNQPAAPWIGLDAVGATPNVADLRINIPDDATGDFTVGTWTAGGNSYEPSTGVWRDERHYPVAYPAIYRGCHHSKCTLPGTSDSAGVDNVIGQGGPFPMRIQDLASIPSSWTVTLPPASQNAIYDVAYDIWLDVGSRPAPMHNSWTSTTNYAGFPEANIVATQPYGTEIMIWVNSSGYDAANFKYDATTKSVTGTTINPAGMRVVSDQHIPSLDADPSVTWDIFVGKGRSVWPYKAASPTEFNSFDTYWNIVSFVRRQKITSFKDLDTARFIRYLYQQDSADPENKVMGHCPINYDANAKPTWTTQFVGDSEYLSEGMGNEACAAPSWWLASIQAGFEIWANGTGLGSSAFEVKPKASVAISTDRLTDDLRPLQNWHNYFGIYQDLKNACSDGSSPTSVSYSLTANEADASANDLGIKVETNDVLMAKVFDDYWWTLATPLYSRSGVIVGTTTKVSNVILHGEVTVNIKKTCSGKVETNTISMYVDPSGKVVNQYGAPVSGAKVTLYQQQGGAWVQVPNGSAVMSPVNRTNPDVTSASIGAFGWDTLPGTYKVRAESPGCYAPGIPTQPYTETGAITVPSPVSDLALVLFCPSAVPGYVPPSGGDTAGLKVTTAVSQNWTTGGAGKGGFCETVQLTNTTSAPISGWQVTIPVEKSALYTSWNATYSQPSSTQVRVKNQDNWVKTIQPGQTTSKDWLGFCVNRVP